jgi:hypothetical protein
MSSYQPFASPDFFKESIEAQMALFNAMSKSFFDASALIGELNAQAAGNVMEMTCANFQRGLQIASTPAVNSFFGHPFWAPYDLPPAYPAAASMPVSAPAAASDRPDASVKDTGVRENPVHGDQKAASKPSALIEKMIATVIEDGSKTDKKS